MGPLTDTFNTCRFDENAFSSNKPFIAGVRREVHDEYLTSRPLDNADMYAACMGGSATIFWPFALLATPDAAYWVPGGVVVVDRHGDLSIDDNGAVAGDYPGPVVPFNVVDDVVDAAARRDAEGNDIVAVYDTPALFSTLPPPATNGM